ncbi:MAG TPA: hypothetical protein VG452_06335 [Egibacteraceae bacterium]|nr:hypothetical protein [Actinomycetota bacterium]HWB71817.1 hypothetical protein [Egibacteraceae bacterium]
MGRFVEPPSSAEADWGSSPSDSGPGYELDPAEARALHAPVHEPGCWCQGLDPVAFLDQLFRRRLQPRGFRRPSFSEGNALVLVGPGIADRRVDLLHDAIRSPRERP